jgi:nitroreductase
METIEAIMTRRSVRKYSDKKVPDDVVQQILQAAMSSPSAGNEQPWHFIVIKDRKTLLKIPSFHPHSHMLKNAALAILVCYDPGLEMFKGRGILDCSAATENILLAAHAMGLGAVWLGIYPVEERMNGMRKLLGLPSQIMPLSLVSMGYPAEKLKEENRYKQERVHYERWMGRSDLKNKNSKEVK